MKLDVVPFNLDLLVKSEHLLRASFDGEFDVKDEIEFFNSANHSGWFIALSEGLPVGFIRQFAINEDECRGDFYVSDENVAVAEVLARTFAESFNPPRRTRVSF